MGGKLLYKDNFSGTVERLAEKVRKVEELESMPVHPKELFYKAFFT